MDRKLFLSLLISIFVLCGLGCTKKHFENISENLPKHIHKTIPCKVGDVAFWENVYVSNDGRALLLSKHGEKIRYYTEEIPPEQDARSWFDSFFRKMAEDAVKTGVSGIRFYAAIGEPKHVSEEGVTYYVSSPFKDEFKKSSMLCAITPDHKYVIFSAANVMLPKSELISKLTVYKRAFSGEDRTNLEVSIIEEVSAKLKKETGSIIERSPASLRVRPAAE